MQKSRAQSTWLSYLIWHPVEYRWPPDLLRGSPCRTRCKTPGANSRGWGAGFFPSQQVNSTPSLSYHNFFSVLPTVTTLFLLLLLLWTLELYLILSYRSLDLLISWSYRSYLDDLILAILSRRSTILSWSLDLFIRWWSKIHFFYFITYMHLTCLWLMSFIYDW